MYFALVQYQNQGVSEPKHRKGTVPSCIPTGLAQGPGALARSDPHHERQPRNGFQARHRDVAGEDVPCAAGNHETGFPQLFQRARGHAAHRHPHECVSSENNGEGNRRLYRALRRLNPAAIMPAPISRIAPVPGSGMAVAATPISAEFVAEFKSPSLL